MFRPASTGQQVNITIIILYMDRHIYIWKSPMFCVALSLRRCRCSLKLQIVLLLLKRVYIEFKYYADAIHSGFTLAGLTIADPPG